MIDNDTYQLQNCPVGTYFLRNSLSDSSENIKVLVFVNSSQLISKYKIRIDSNKVSLLNQKGEPIPFKKNGIFFASAEFASVEHLTNYLETTGIIQGNLCIKFQKLSEVNCQRTQAPNLFLTESLHD